MDIMQIGNKADRALVNVKSDEATLTIKAGAPVFLQLDATDDGLAVISSENLGAHEFGLTLGLAMADILPGQFGKAMAYGVHVGARVVLATRSASTADWASYPAGVIGDILSVVSASVGTIQAVSRAASGSVSAGFDFYFRLGSAFASSTTQPSSTNTDDVALFKTTTSRVFVRCM